MFRVIYKLATKEVASILLAEDGETQFNQQIYGIIQGDPDTILSLAITLNMDTAPIIDFMNDQGIDTTLIEERLKVERDIAFGRKIKIQFLAEQKGMDLSYETDIAMLQALAPLIALLDIGAIKQANHAWQQVPVNAIITQERKDAYSDMMAQYLNISDIENI